MTGIADRVLRSSFFRILSLLVNVAVSFFMIPYVIGHIGDRWYGLWVLVGATIGYFGFLDLGIGMANERYIARALGQKNQEEINRIVSSSIALFAMIGTAALALTAVIIALCPRFLSNPQEITTFRIVILLAGFDLAISFPVRAYWGFLYAHIRYDVVNIFNIAKTITRTGLIVYVLGRGHGIIALAVVALSSNLLEYAGAILYVRRRYPQTVVRLRDFSKRMVLQLYDYSLYSFLSTMARQMRFNIDSFVISAVLGLSFVTHYNIGSRIAAYFLIVMTNAISTMKPVFSKLEGESDYGRLRQRYYTTFKLNLILSIFIGGTLLIYGRAFILRWMGPAYFDSWRVLAVLAVAMIFSTIQVTPSELLYGISKHKRYSLIVVLEGATSLGLSLLLVRRYGIVGVAFANAAPALVTTCLFVPLYANSVIAFPNGRYYRTFLAAAGLGAALHVATWLSIRNYIEPSFVRIAVLGLASSAIFLAASSIVMLSREERAALKMPF